MWKSSLPFAWGSSKGFIKGIIIPKGDPSHRSITLVNFDCLKFSTAFQAGWPQIGIYQLSIYQYSSLKPLALRKVNYTLLYVIQLEYFCCILTDPKGEIYWTWTDQIILPGEASSQFDFWELQLARCSEYSSSGRQVKSTDCSLVSHKISFLGLTV